MKIIGLLSWWNEDAGLLFNALTSFAPVVDHVVALDGRYGSLRASEAMSGPDNYAALMSFAAEQEIGLTIHRQVGPWKGDEVEKRTKLFELAEPLIEDGDWYIIIDSDELLQKHPTDLKAKLVASSLDAAEVRFLEPKKAPQPLRILFRALPGLHCQDNHYTYVYGDGRCIWGNAFGGPKAPKPEPALDLTGSMDVLHLSDLDIESARHKAQQSYYKNREAKGLERNMCGLCGKKKAVKTMPYDFKPVFVPVIHPQTGETKRMKSFEASFVDACKTCFNLQKKVNDKVIRGHGFDPDSQDFKRFKLDGLGVKNAS